MVSGPQEGPATYEEKDDKLPVTKEPAWAVITRAPARERGVTAQQSCCSVTKSRLTLWTPWTAVRQASLSFTISQSLLKLMSIDSMMPSNHLILCHPFSSCPQSLPASVFSSELTLCIMWPKYWSFSISSSNEYSGLIFFRITGLISLLSRGL